MITNWTLFVMAAGTCTAYSLNENGPEQKIWTVYRAAAEGSQAKAATGRPGQASTKEKTKDGQECARQALFFSLRATER